MSESLATVEDELEAIGEDARNAQQLPNPKGYKILIALPEPDEATEGGIVKAVQT